jgi:hypothetical protein
VAKYTGMAATPAEQQDSEFNPSGVPLGWVVVTGAGTDDEQPVKLNGVTYMNQTTANLFANIMNKRDDGMTAKEISHALLLDVEYIEWVFARFN